MLTLQLRTIARQDEQRRDQADYKRRGRDGKNLLRRQARGIAKVWPNATVASAAAATPTFGNFRR